MPQTIRSLFDLIEENEAEPRVFGVHAIEILLRQHRAGFTMSQITRRRTDQLGYLVRVLKLGAVNPDNCIRVAEENLGSGFNDARFAGSCRPQEEHRTDRLVGRIHARQEDLIKVARLSYGALLTDNAY